MIFLKFILATIGLTMIVTQSYVFKGIREYTKQRVPWFGKMISCPQCFGFWAALFVQSIILIYGRGALTFYISDFYYLIYGFIGSFVSYLTYLLIRPLMDKYD